MPRIADFFVVWHKDYVSGYQVYELMMRGVHHY